jgi:hypothetical protein
MSMAVHRPNRGTAYVPIAPQVLDLETLPPRIVRMVQAIIVYQQVLTDYETGQVSLNWNGPDVRLQLEKVRLPEV